LPVANVPKYIENIRIQPIEPSLSQLIELPSDGNFSKLVGLLTATSAYEVYVPEGIRCGIISARDVLKAANVEGTKPTALMSHIQVLPKEASIGEAARLMADYRIRSVPVSDGRKIIGQVNSFNLLHLLKGKIGGDLRITSIATKNPITIDVEAPIAKARDLMIRRRIDHVPVTRTGRLTGLLTSTEIITRISPAERLGSKAMKPEIKHSFDFPVGEVMDHNPLTCAAETSVADALDSILSAAQTYILVTQWEELQGIATHRDFITLLAAPEPESDVPIFIVGLPEDPFEAEATKAKFRRTVNQLRRIFPDILEARSVIKSKSTSPGKERGRYEVAVHIRTTRNTYAYSEGGWDLPAVYDLITDRLKRLMTQKQTRRRTREREGPRTL
jgi:CBS domain-containing protein